MEVGGKRESIYLSYTVTTRMTYVALIVRDKVTTRLSTNHNLFKEKGEPSGIEPRPLCFKPAHKPSCRPPLVIPPHNSLEMGRALDGSM